MRKGTPIFLGIPANFITRNGGRGPKRKAFMTQAARLQHAGMNQP